MAAAAEDTTHDGPPRHRMRITANGQIQNYVSFALTHLKDPTTPPLVLHNLPAQSPSKPEALEKACTTALHRLISVVEIIKREYTVAVRKELHVGNTAPVVATHGDTDAVQGRKTSRAKRKRDRMTPLPIGLHQYNQIVSLEDLGLLPRPEPTADEAKVQFIEGRTALRQKHTPALLVTLSRSTLTEGTLEADSCHQPPHVIQSKGRKKKRRKALGRRRGQQSTIKGAEVDDSVSVNAGTT